MRIGMVGLGRMGANMVRRLLAGGHECVVFDVNQEAVAALAAEGAIPASSCEEFRQLLAPPRAVWLMLPAAYVDASLQQFAGILDAGDILIDGGNSYFVDDIHRAAELAGSGIHYLDVGTSGGVWGLKRGYCLMIGGDEGAFAVMEPVFRTLAPGAGSIAPTDGRAGRENTADEGFLHCGPAGAGHFVKMVHNGIEYGMMAAFSEGFNILSRANIGKEGVTHDAETAPLRNPEYYQYDLPVADIAELWRRGSVVTSWLLDLTADALSRDEELSSFSGRVSDSGEGRWTVETAIDQGTPAPVLSASLYQRFSSQGEDIYACKILSAMRHGFGGHVEKKQ